MVRTVSLRLNVFATDQGYQREDFDREFAGPFGDTVSTGQDSVPTGGPR